MMSHIHPFPFTLNVYNILSPEFSNFLVNTYPAFFADLFEKYLMLYGQNPHYLFVNHCFQKKQRSESPSPIKPLTKNDENNCQTSKDIQATYFKFFGFLQEISDNWNVIMKDENIELLKKEVKDSPCWVIKAKAYLEGISANQVFEAIYDINIRRKWDTVFDEFLQVKNINENLDVIYYSISVPFPFITSREFLQRRHFIHHFPAFNQSVIQFKSIEMEEVPHDPKKIRGETLVSGYLITALGKNSCQLELISMVDIKGAVPKVIYNMVASKAPVSWIENLKNYCQGKPIVHKIF